MNKQEFLNYIIDCAVCTGWEDCHGKDQIRALFTSWCLIFHIDVDTKERDDALNVIYWRGDMGELIKYKDYEQFMIEFIVSGRTKEEIMNEFVRVCKYGSSRDCRIIVYEAARNGISYEELCEYKRNRQDE